MKNSIGYRELKSEDKNYFPIGTELLKSAAGEQGVGDRQVELFAAASECCVFGAFINDELIGIGLGGIIPKNQYEFYAVFSNSIFNIFLSEKIGTLLFVAVKEEYKGFGVGKKLLELRQNWLKSNGAQFALASSWKNNKKFSSPRLFIADGFEEVSHFCTYIHPSIETNPCPICKPTCHCENYIFIKKL
jgi:GNAT superfamily N-acetyltransferase